MRVILPMLGLVIVLVVLYFVLRINVIHQHRTRTGGASARYRFVTGKSTSFYVEEEDIEFRAKKLLSQTKEILSKWYELTLSTTSALQYPLLVNLKDSDVQKTIALISKVRFNQQRISANSSKEQIDDFEDLIEQLTVQINWTVTRAKRDHDSSFTVEEKSLLQKTRTLLELVQNEGATPHERRLAYGRLESLINRLQLNITLEDDVQLQITTRSFKAIEQKEDN